MNSMENHTWIYKSQQLYTFAFYLIIMEDPNYKPKFICQLRSGMNHLNKYLARINAVESEEVYLRQKELISVRPHPLLGTLDGAGMALLTCWDFFFQLHVFAVKYSRIPLVRSCGCTSLKIKKIATH